MSGVGHDRPAHLPSPTAVGMESGADVCPGMCYVVRRSEHAVIRGSIGRKRPVGRRGYPCADIGSPGAIDRMRAGWSTVR